MASSFRIGIGYDIHRLKKGRPLYLGGLLIPAPKGLDGHSDADVLLHAITDAILGAAALPDIGTYFPPGRSETKNIRSSVMLTRAVQEAERLGYRIGNVDTVIIAESQKIAPHRDAIRRTVSRLLKVSIADVQVKGKTNEGLDTLGKGLAIAAYAVVLLQEKDVIRG